MALFAKVTIILLSLASTSLGNECPKIVTQKGFDVNKYVGQWYEAYRADVIYEVGSTCVNATYTLNADGSVHVLNQAINFLGQFSTIEGTATVKNASEPAAFELVFNALQKGEYNVISSDYTQYSLVYACRIIPVVNVKLDFIWMLSRTKTLPPSIYNELKNIISGMGASVQNLKQTVQNC